MDAFTIGEFLYVGGVFLLALVWFLWYVERERLHIDDLWIGLTLIIGSLIILSLLIAGMCLLFLGGFSDSPELYIIFVLFGGVTVFGVTFYGFVKGAILAVPEIVHKIYRPIMESKNAKLEIEEEIHKINLEQEKILEQWEHSPYAAESRNKNKLNNEAENIGQKTN